MGKLFIRNTTGEGISIPLEELSAGDLKYVRKMVPPEMGIRASRKKDKLKMPDATSGMEEVWQITLEIDVTKKSNARFDGRLAAQVMLIAEDELSGHYLLLDRKPFFPVFNDQNNGKYTFSTTTKVRRWMEYNNEMRGYDYAGYIIMLDGPNGKRLLTDTDLNGFEDGAATLIETYPIFTFFDQTGRKKSVPRVRYTEARY
jgi:hypothetical protein